MAERTQTTILAACLETHDYISWTRVPQHNVQCCSAPAQQQQITMNKIVLKVQHLFQIDRV
jgi:hypothetical protein